mgnify:CR=1 FL=1
MFKNYLSRYAVKNGVKLLLTSTNPLKSIKYIRVGMSGISELKTYSQNMINNVEYLKSNNMFNSHNLTIVHKQSSIMSGYNLIFSDLSCCIFFTISSTTSYFSSSLQNGAIVGV